MLVEKRRILLIDDEIDKCEIFLKAMEKIPALFKYSFVNNTADALQYVNKITPDFIFFDMDKPGPDDLSSLETIRTQRHIRHIPFFVYATTFSENISNKATELGVSKCVKKPKDVRTLVKFLKKLFHQSRRAEIRNYAPRQKA